MWALLLSFFVVYSALVHKAFYYIRIVFQSILKTLYPPYCRVCSVLLQNKKPFCSACELSISPVVSLTLPIKGKQSLKVFAVGAYKKPLRSLVLAKRSTDLLVFEQLGQLIIEKIPLQTLHMDYLVPVPLHWTRYAYRGYNQAEEIARYISKSYSIPLFKFLKRVKRTPFQSLQPQKKRHENVKNVFAFRCSHEESLKQLQGKHLVLIDDLCTTGATRMSFPTKN